MLFVQVLAGIIDGIFVGAGPTLTVIVPVVPPLFGICAPPELITRVTVYVP